MALLENNAHITVRKLLKQLEGRGIKIPADVTKAVATLDRVEKSEPVERTVQDIAAAYQAEDVATAEQYGTDIARYGALKDGWARARGNVANAALRAISRNAEALVEQLAELAAPLIADLEHAAKVNVGDLAVLLRDGRTEDAAVVARLDYTSGELAALYGLRDGICKGADFGKDYGNDCRYWKDPNKALEARVQFGGREPSRGDLYVAGIRYGAVLWFPTPDQAEQASRAIERPKVTA